jgi:hypothetical protein
VVNEMLTRRMLDDLKCGNPDCTHDHSVIVLKGACHPAKRSDLFWDEPSHVLTVRCAACAFFIASIVLATGQNPTTRCHPHSPVRASYDKRNVRLRVECGRCDAIVEYRPWGI